jgi:glycosyltransferase involved in cell wall biosynthesis
MNAFLSTVENGNRLRPHVEGKFLVVDNEKFYVRGVTYGTFQPDKDGFNFPAPSVVEKDFALMSSFGINSVRTYTVPPLYLLDYAGKYNLKVLVGLPWEQHITFLDDENRVKRIVNQVRESVRSCKNHPAILAYTLGNEIPASIVRWYGHNRIEEFLKRLYKAGKEADPNGLFTYVNYPTTEYLDTSFTDFDCFNVYLESKEKLESYLARLHNLCGDRPLVMAEIGLDSRRNGEAVQADSLDWQIRSVFSKGCAGAFVFAWTDEWWRGGFAIEDWDFGLTDRERRPKPALHAVSKAFRESPFPASKNFPKISVVVCSYNGSATIRDCMEGLQKVVYPNFEVIVVNDGSTDSLAEIVREYPVRLISTPNRGLSNARNTGMEAATGEIVAYIDDDAYPDQHWLQYLAHAFMTTNHAGIGGPNISPAGDGIIADSIANAPGGPVHVLLTDEIAEHIPGCNMAFRREALLEVGGCDPIYRAAGDDVDLCWRIQQTGKTIGFHPAAFVWHHCRNSIKMYWQQQKGYGKAEALLEKKWSERYNGLGHLNWSGRIYGKGLTLPLNSKKDSIFYGIWGTAPFQSIYQPMPDTLSAIPLMPEWYLFIASLTLVSLLGMFWTPLFLAFPLSIALILVIFVQAGVSASKAVYTTAPKTEFEKLWRWGLTTFLHLMQPLARLYGRLTHGLKPWRIRGINDLALEFVVPKACGFSLWSEDWKSIEDWVRSTEAKLIELKVPVKRGGEFERWDLEVRCGLLAACRGLFTVEEHGAGKQLVRLCCQMRYSRPGIVLFSVFIALALFATFDNAFVAAAILGVFSLVIGAMIILDAARAMRNFSAAFLGREIITASTTGAVDTNTVGLELDNHPIIARAVGAAASANLESRRKDV